MLSMRRLINVAVFTGLLAGGTNFAFAGLYNVAIDTSGVTGTIGGIYLQFNPGVASDPASVVIKNFIITGPGGLLTGTPGGALFPAGIDGDVTGALDNLPLTLHNTAALNDYLQYLTFADSMAFQLAFNLPATLSGDPSAFGLEITGPDGLSSIFPTDPNNFNVEMTFDPAGNISISNTTSLIAITPSTSTAPEPGSFVLLLTAIALITSWKHGSLCWASLVRKLSQRCI